jgi:hypothetical protein
MKTKHTCRASAGRLFYGQSIIRWCQTRHYFLRLYAYLSDRDENAFMLGPPNPLTPINPGTWIDALQIELTRPIRALEGRSGL